jgi:lantibiotic modifying enzyme
MSLPECASQANAPSLEGVTLSPNDYVKNWWMALSKCIGSWWHNGRHFLATDGPLTALAHQRVRCVFRPTQVYASVLQKSLQPQYLRDGADRSIELEVLSRALLWTDSKHPSGHSKGRIAGTGTVGYPLFCSLLR